MFRAFAVITLFFSLVLFTSVSTAMAKDKITEFHSGVKVVWKLPEDEIVKMSKIKRFDRYAVVRVIKNELQKYPKGFLGEIIDSIYLARNASVHGVNIGGLAKPVKGEKGEIYLTSWNESKAVLRHKLHHEIAHHLFNRSPRTEKIANKWFALLPEGFRYYGNGLKAAKAGAITDKPLKDLYKDGFMSAYAATSIHEDFAELAGSMMAGEKATWKAIDKNPALKQKAELVAELMQSMDDKYTLKYMRYRF